MKTMLTTLLFVAILTCAPAAARPSTNGWTGDWTMTDLVDISIRTDDESGGARLVIKGAAIAASVNSFNTGGFEADVPLPRGDAISFTTMDDHRALPYAAGDKFDCRLRMTLVGPSLNVVDNGSCGGLNVSFSGRYRRHTAHHQAPIATSINNGSLATLMFACRAGGRVITIRGTGGHATWTTTRSGRVELAMNGGSHANIGFAGGGEEQLIFEHAGTRYVAWSRMVAPHSVRGSAESDGVLVKRGGRIVATWRCSPHDAGYVSAGGLATTQPVDSDLEHH